MRYEARCALGFSSLRLGAFGRLGWRRTGVVAAVKNEIYFVRELVRGLATITEKKCELGRDAAREM